MSYEIKLRFRRFSCETCEITGLIVYYIAQRPQDARRGLPVSRAHDLVNFGFRLRAATVSPCIITMDHDAIIYFMTDRLARGPDQDVHVPSVGSQKYPSRGVDVIYL